jgi:diadenosine tetraphosphate (Ap4A) HIT family hydrolase
MTAAEHQSYADLLHEVQPRPIRTKADYRNQLEWLEHLMGLPTTRDTSMMIEMLSMTLGAYEAQQFPIPVVAARYHRRVPEPDRCAFCQRDRDRVLDDELVHALRDAYPVSPGHTLVICNRHVATYFDATPQERAAIWAAVERIKSDLDATLQPDGYNVGFNAGPAAGQTVMHLHVHVIPRFVGDTKDPRGGVRGVIPDKQKYGDGE